MDAHREELVRVFQAASVAEGYLAKGLLEAEGIPVLVRGEGEGPYRTGGIHLWIPAGLAVQARLILDTVGEHVADEEERDEEADGAGD